MRSQYFLVLALITLILFDHGQSFNIVSYSDGKFGFKKEGMAKMATDLIKAASPLLKEFLNMAEMFIDNNKKLLEQTTSIPKDAISELYKAPINQAGVILSSLVVGSGYDDSQCVVENQKKSLYEELKKIEECLADPVKNAVDELKKAMENTVKLLKKIGKMDKPEQIVDTFQKMDRKNPSGDDQKALADSVKIWDVALEVYDEFMKCFNAALPKIVKQVFALGKEYLACAITGN